MIGTSISSLLFPCAYLPWFNTVYIPAQNIVFILQQFASYMSYKAQYHNFYYSVICFQVSVVSPAPRKLSIHIECLKLFLDYIVHGMVTLCLRTLLTLNFCHIYIKNIEYNTNILLSCYLWNQKTKGREKEINMHRESPMYPVFCRCFVKIKRCI